MALSSNDILTNAVGSSGAALPAVEIFSLGSVSGAAALTISPPAYVRNMLGAEAGGFAVAGTANKAYLVPTEGIVATYRFTRIFIHLNVSSGNIDLGVYYTDDEATFTRLFSLGSTASPGANKRVITISQQTIIPLTGRRWFIAFAADNAVATWACAQGANNQTSGPAFTKTSSFPLPVTLTGVSDLADNLATTPIMLGV